MLKEAGIPVIAVDDALEDESGNKLAPWVGIDGYNIGKATGEWAADYITTNNLKDDNSFGLLYMGKAYQKLGQAETATACFERASLGLSEPAGMLANLDQYVEFMRRGLGAQ